MQSKKIDIIIPIYNAFDYVKACIQSLIHTDPGFYNYTIYLINDCSTDTNIKILIDEVAKKEKNFVSIHNESNLGFVGTCNKGILLSDQNDVLLLNSDTEVTKNWLLKLYKAAYSLKNVATVSPFTNSGAGILNIPDFYKNNSIPVRHSLESWSRTVEEVSLKDYIRTYTNVGYCFYIRRDAIKKIGLLDYETFGKGNGEEVDFCLRARRAGFVNLIATDTFIQHEGNSVSFKELEKTEKNNSKKLLVEKHTKIIENRYPEFRLWLDYILTFNPWIPYHRLFFFFAEFYSKKKRILHFVNNISNINYGGTENIVNQITNKLNDYDHFLVKIESSHFIIKNVETKQIFYIPLGQKLDIFKLRNLKLLKNLETVLKILNPNLVIFHSIRFLPTNFYNVFLKIKIPYYIYFHDFSSIYPPYWNLGVFDNNLDLKSNILNLAKNQQEKTYYNTRLEDINLVFNYATKVVAPSEYVFRLLKNFYSSNNLFYVENGIAINKTNFFTIFNDSEDINIFWLGNFSIVKGANLFLEIIDKFITNNFYTKKKLKFHIFGFIVDDTLKNIVNHSKYKDKLTIHDGYKNDELFNLLKDMHICILPFSNEETYSLVLSELINLNKYIIACDKGVVGERLKKYGLGILFNSNNFVSEVLEHILAITKSLYEKEIQRVKKVHSNHIENTIEKIKSFIKHDIKSKDENSMCKDKKISWFRYVSLVYTLDFFPALVNQTNFVKKLKIRIFLFILRFKNLYKLLKFFKDVMKSRIKLNKILGLF